MASNVQKPGWNPNYRGLVPRPVSDGLEYDRNTLTSFRSQQQAVNQSLTPTIQTKYSAYTLKALDFTILADATNAAFTVMLDTKNCTQGKVYTIKRINAAANNVTCQPTLGLIDGAANSVLSAQYDSIIVTTDGTNWWIH